VALQEQGWSEHLQEGGSPGTGLERTPTGGWLSRNRVRESCTTCRRCEPWWSGARKITSPSTSTKELIGNYRRQQRRYTPIHINKTERVKGSSACTSLTI
jgi:hypothetical protein